MNYVLPDIQVRFRKGRGSRDQIANIRGIIKKARGVGSIPGSGRYSGEGNGNPLQYFCLGNPMDREAWQATVHGVAEELDTT